MNRNNGGEGVFTQCYWLAAEEEKGGEYPQVYVNKTAAVFLRNHVSRHKGQKGAYGLLPLK